MPLLIFHFGGSCHHSQGLSKEYRLREQVASLVDHIYIIAATGERGVRSEIEKNLLSPCNSLNNFSARKFFYKAKKKSSLAAIIIVGFATRPHPRYFHWVRANGSENGKCRKNYLISMSQTFDTSQ